jgi:hypothetical protein
MENVSVNPAKALQHGGIAASRPDGVRLREHEYLKYWRLSRLYYTWAHCFPGFRLGSNFIV